MEVNVSRKLRLLFDQFPKNHNLVPFGQPELMHNLSLSANKDIKSPITYSAHIKARKHEDMLTLIADQLKRSRSLRGV